MFVVVVVVSCCFWQELFTQILTEVLNINEWIYSISLLPRRSSFSTFLSCIDFSYFEIGRNIKFKTDRYKNSFFPLANSSWNKIISHFEDFPSLDCLKGHVLSFFRPKNKSNFGVHDPVGLRYLFQLIVSISPLRSHKGRHNFVDTPSDICHCDQGVENTYHFKFICPTYVTQRATLITAVNEILLKNNLNHLEDLNCICMDMIQYLTRITVISSSLL